MVTVNAVIILKRVVERIKENAQVVVVNTSTKI
jgi:hypothetical protein